MTGYGANANQVKGIRGTELIERASSRESDLKRGPARNRKDLLLSECGANPKPSFEYRLGSVRRSKEEGVVVASFGAVAGDLAGSVDGVGVDQHPAGVGRDQVVQVLHTAG
jgi:hypothetical protein